MGLGTNEKWRNSQYLPHSKMDSKNDICYRRKIVDCLLDLTGSGFLSGVEYSYHKALSTPLPTTAVNKKLYKRKLRKTVPGPWVLSSTFCEAYLGKTEIRKVHTQKNYPADVKVSQSKRWKKKKKKKAHLKLPQASRDGNWGSARWDIVHQ